MVKIFGFFAPIRFRGDFEGIGKMLCGKVSGMSVFQRLRKCGERKKETAGKYNGSLALATLERATIINM